MPVTGGAVDEDPVGILRSYGKTGVVAICTAQMLEGKTTDCFL